MVMTSVIRYPRHRFLRRLLSYSSALLLVPSIHSRAHSTLLPARPTFSEAFTRGTLIAVNQGDHDISLVDPSTGLEFRRIPEGAVTGHEVATSLDGQLAFFPI